MIELSDDAFKVFFGEKVLRLLQSEANARTNAARPFGLSAWSNYCAKELKELKEDYLRIHIHELGNQFK